MSGTYLCTVGSTSAYTKQTSHHTPPILKLHSPRGTIPRLVLSSCCCRCTHLPIPGLPFGCLLPSSPALHGGRTYVSPTHKGCNYGWRRYGSCGF
eukprot:6478093-Amphidinium_carterae.1